MQKSTVIVSFSSKNEGNCEHISAYIKSLECDSTILYRFTDFQLHPCGNCCYECFQRADNCPHINDKEHELLEAICRSEKTFFIVPNYCDYPCANFFIFNERSQCYFQGHPERLDVYLAVPKQFIVVSNSEQDNFRQAFRQHTAGEPDILFLSAKHYGKRSIAGDILESQTAKQAIEDFVKLVAPF